MSDVGGPVIPMSLSYPANVGLNQNFTLTLGRVPGNGGALDGTTSAFCGSFSNLPETLHLNDGQDSQAYPNVQVTSATCSDDGGTYAGVTVTVGANSKQYKVYT